MTAGRHVTPCTCGHGKGYHTGPSGSDKPGGRCYRTSCDCEQWTINITEPGVYQIDADEYHADPIAGGSLSSSGARQLIAPSCPARYRHNHDHGGDDHRPHFDFGHAAHRLVLGDGPEIVVIDADNWRTKAAKAERDEAHSAGAVPLLAADYEQVEAMAAAITAHPIAAAAFGVRRGKAEQTLVWRDDRTGIMRRARLDWLPEPVAGGRLIVPDYKTCHSADPDALSKAAYQFGYHQQADWYLAGVRALRLDTDPAFVFVAQEKDPPYLVTVFELDHVAMRIGAIRNRRAIDVYLHCTETGHWPAYVDGVAQLALPRWAEIEEGEHLT